MRCAYPSANLLLLDSLVDGRVELELFGALGGLEADHYVGDSLSVAS